MGPVRDSAISTVSPENSKPHHLKARQQQFKNSASIMAQKLNEGIHRQVGDTIYLHFSSRTGK